MDVKGPVLYDSLDRPNAGSLKGPYGYGNNNAQKPRDYTGIVIGAMSIIAVLLVLLFAWVIRTLQQDAYEGDQFAITMLTLLKGAPVIALSVGLICATLFSVQWLRAWAIKKNLVSVQDGPHYRADEVRLAYESMFREMFGETMEVAKRRADKSIYAGVQTLTVDQSTSSTTTETKSSDAPIPAIVALDELDKE